MSFPLPLATLCDVGLAADPLDRLFRIIDEHVATGRYPGAQIAIARHGQLAIVKTFCDFTLEWVPGSQVHYHGRAAHWVAAVLIEALAKTDYRTFIRDNVAEPLGLGGELFVGLPDVEGKRAADIHEPGPDGHGQVRRAEENTVEFRRAGSPAGGGYATARAMAAFYQMMANGGTLNGVRLLSPRMVEYVTR